MENEASWVPSGAQETRVFYRIDATVTAGPLPVWHTIPGECYCSLDEAQLALADDRRFPMTRNYRVVEVTERRVG